MVKKIYCALSDNFDNLLIMDLYDDDKRYYLSGHYFSMTGDLLINMAI